MKTFKLFFETNGEELAVIVEAKDAKDAVSQGEMREYNDYFADGEAHFVGYQEMESA